MAVLTIDEVQSHLSEIIDRLQPGEEVVITRDNRPVARLLGGQPLRLPRQHGNCVGLARIVSDDDEHLSDFAEYMG